MTLYAFSDMWYVNIDGKEGWLPSSLLQIMADDGLLDTSGGSSLSGSRNESTETSAEPSDSEGMLYAVMIVLQWNLYITGL